MRVRLFTLLLLIVSSGLTSAAANKDCVFLSNPDQFTDELWNDHRKALCDMTARVVMSRPRDMVSGQSAGQTLDATRIPHKNIIDDAIFGRMAAPGIRSAPLASDIEYLRRVTLDLTGRIPSGADVVTFMADTDPSKRDAKVDGLIGSPEFIDKWTMFLGDLFKNKAVSNNVNRQIQERDAFYLYLKDTVSTNKPYDQLARELITGSGDSFAQGEANWPLGNTIAMGSVQDTYDGQSVNLASMFLGINVVDCLLCHGGARHLDQVNFGAHNRSARTCGNNWKNVDE